MMKERQVSRDEIALGWEMLSTKVVEEIESVRVEPEAQDQRIRVVKARQ
jgi:hypothetical protein